MRNRNFFLRQAQRKRTIAGFIFGGFIIIGLVAVGFYGTLQQERQLTVIDPVDTDVRDEGQVVITDDFFEPAGETSIDNQELYDEQRRANVEAIHEALQSYYAEHDSYPTLTQLNSEGFRTQNFSDVPTDTFKDPADAGSRISITRTPQPNVYSYDVLNEDGYTCEPAGRSCVSYTLSAVLGGGLAFTLASDDDS